eukprot:6172538-Pleurochrysis_carterae.AAC.5
MKQPSRDCVRVYKLQERADICIVPTKIRTAHAEHKLNSLRAAGGHMTSKLKRLAKRRMYR